MILLEFIFQDFWHFIGIIILIGCLIPSITIRKTTEKTSETKKEKDL